MYTPPFSYLFKKNSKLFLPHKSIHSLNQTFSLSLSISSNFPHLVFNRTSNKIVSDGWYLWETKKINFNFLKIINNLTRALRSKQLNNANSSVLIFLRKYNPNHSFSTAKINHNFFNCKFILPIVKIIENKLSNSNKGKISY